MAGRFESREAEWFDDGWGEDEMIERAAKRPKTVIHIEQARSIISVSYTHLDVYKRQYRHTVELHHAIGFTISAEHHMG